MKRTITTFALITAMLTGGALIATNEQAAAASGSNCEVIGYGSAPKTRANSSAKNTAIIMKDGKAAITFYVKGTNCQTIVSAYSFTSQSRDGSPFSQQKQYQRVGGTFKEGKHTLTVDYKDCFYQIDLVKGAGIWKPGTGMNKDRLGAFDIGGNKKCVDKPTKPPVKPPVTPPTTPPVTPPETPETPETPEVPEEPETPVVEEQPEELQSVGATSNALIGLFVLAVIGGVVYRQLKLRRN